MRYVLENDTLRVEIDSFGAELKSVKRKSDDKEYMWYADKKYWGRTSPVLFPFVGNCRNKEYRYGGKTYAIGQHGFARDMEHTMESQTEDTIWFSLHSNEETMEKYPFAFVLKIGYNLTGRGTTLMRSRCIFPSAHIRLSYVRFMTKKVSLDMACNLQD